MRILLVENSKTLVSLMSVELTRLIDVTIDWVETKEKAIAKVLEHGAQSYCLAITGLHLTDAPRGESVQVLTEFQIPTIIFSSVFNEELRESFIKTPGVVDYVVKENLTSLVSLCNTAYRLLANRKIKALVVEDSRAMRMYICELLRQYQFKVMEAENGLKAVEIMKEHRDIKLIVTDYNMEGMDGFELTKHVRETYGKEELAIIGLSGSGNATLSARFIKTGANDFLSKPFQPEEFYCRVTQNMELIEKTQKLIDAATKDFLTGLYNRRFFFENGEKKLRRLQNERKSAYVVMLDIDHFKSVNDTFGHDVGDEVLQVVSSVLRENVRECDLVARLGGEEFCIILEDVNCAQATDILENIRIKIEGRHFNSLKDRGNVTSSFGAVGARKDENLDSLTKRADELLYKAKQTGRNRVAIQ